jgi:hypothetical protein
MEGHKDKDMYVYMCVYVCVCSVCVMILLQAQKISPAIDPGIIMFVFPAERRGEGGWC